MTEKQKEKIFDLAGCNFVPGCFDKRFVRDMAAKARSDLGFDLSAQQAACLDTMHHRYRRQIKDYEKRYGKKEVVW